MKKFYKFYLKKILYKSVKFLLPCVVIFSLLFSSLISVSALTIDAKDTEFELTSFAFYDPNIGAGSLMDNVYTDGVNSETTINNGGSFVVFPSITSDSGATELRPHFKSLYNSGVNGVLTVSVKCYDGFFPYWVIPDYCYITDGNNVKIAEFVKNGDGSISATYEGPLPSEFSILTICDLDNQLSEVFYYNISFSTIHSGADSTNYDLYENVERELLDSQQTSITQGLEFVQSINGMPTQGMRNGLAVVSQFMTKFINFNEFRSLFNISLVLGLFAFIVGMAIFVTRSHNKGGK